MSVSVEMKKLTEQLFDIGGFIVDAKRGTISKDGHLTAVEPKVMQVLLYLVVHAENVVEQNVLFEFIWPRSVFSPTSLRRCIASLRKAFADTDKTLISTHPKIGYSINATPILVSKVPLKNSTLINRGLISVAVFIVILLLVSFVIYKPSVVEHPPQISNMTPITATESLEDFIAISPDGKHLAFVRYQDKQIKLGKLWLKNLLTQQEFELPLPAAYRRNVNWSADGKSLIFVEVTQSGWAIYQTLIENKFFENKLLDNKKVSEPVLLFTMPNSTWISSIHLGVDNELYFIARDNQQKHLYKYVLATKHLIKLLPNTAEFTPYEIDLSNDAKQLAVTGKSDSGEYYLKVLDVDNGQLIPLAAALSYGLELQQQYNVQWLANDTSWLLNNGSRLFHLSSSGELTKLAFEHSQFIRFAQPSPDGKSIFLVSEKLDNDFWHYNLENHNKTKIIDSNAMDYWPSISPDDKKIAYYSSKYGKPQLFLYNLDTKTERLIFTNPDEHLNASIANWSQSGKQFTFSVGEQVYIANIEQSQFNVRKVKGLLGIPLNWYPDEKSLLVNRKDHEGYRLIRWNLADGTEQYISDIEHKNIFLSPDQKLISISSQAIVEILPHGEVAQLAKFNSKVTRILSTVKGLYIQTKSIANAWLFWSYQHETLSAASEVSLEMRVAAFSHNKSFVITNDEAKQQDILKLSIK